METTTRRTFLRNVGLFAASALVIEGLHRPALADKPVNFSGWVFKPDTVRDYVGFYNQKFGGQVKYEAIPWAQYHPTMETRAFAGEIVDVMTLREAEARQGQRHPLLAELEQQPVRNDAAVHDRLLLGRRAGFRREEPAHRRPGARGRTGDGALAKGLQGRPREPGSPDEDVLDGHAPADVDGAVCLPHEPLLLPENDRR